MPPLRDRRIDAARDAEALVGLLVEAKDRVPERLRERILAFGPEVIGPLIAMADNEELASEDAPGEGWAPIHAVELLSELRPPEAIAPLIRVLARTDWGDIIHDEALKALPAFGSAALEPLLALHAEATDDTSQSSALAVLAKLGVRDDRVYQALARDMEREPIMGAIQLAEYGDPRGLPLVSAALDRFEPQGKGLLADMGLADLIAAIEMLGGELTPAQQENVRRLRVPRETPQDRMLSVVGQAVGQVDLTAAPDPERPARSAPKVGRNDLCPCGSGKKYKKCCLNA